MNGEELVERKSLFTPSPKDPVVICGLPGSGYVGKLAVEHLIRVFNAKRFTEFKSPSFPPQANVGDDGRVHPMRGEFYFAETGQGKDLLIFTADAQPTTSLGEYELSDILVRDGKQLGASLVVALAAYITGNFSEDQRVYGTSTSAGLGQKLSENGVRLMKGGTITGMNGLVLGMAGINGMQGICLLGETSGYMVDPAASEHVLDALSKILDLKIDLSSLKERAVEAKELMEQIQRMAASGQQDLEGGAVRQPGPSGQPGYIG